jgi:hypothetical protein
MNAVAHGAFPSGRRAKDKAMTAKGLAVLSMAGAVLALCACATPEEPAQVSPAAPPSSAPSIASPGSAVVSPQGPASQPAKAAASAKSPHRQYLDQRSGRYYYFDQTTHRYYWEDGTPRY